MTEAWKPIPGFEGRYSVSDTGRVRSEPFLQGYVLRNGVRAFRRTKPKILSQQRVNSGYAIVHLYLGGSRSALTVHRLVARCFCAGYWPEAEVNHINGVKLDNRAENLEWLSSRQNHIHAVEMGLNSQARAVVSPATAIVYPSVASAAREERRSPKTVRKWASAEVRNVPR